MTDVEAAYDRASGVAAGCLALVVFELGNEWLGVEGALGGYPLHVQAAGAANLLVFAAIWWFATSWALGGGSGD